MSIVLSILLLEDDPSSIRLFSRKVQSAPVEIVVKEARNRETFLKELELSKFDCIVIDYVVPDISGIEALRFIKEMAPDTPTIIYTGSVGEEKAVECMKEGASEFLLKTNSIRLVPAILSVVNQKREHEARLQAEEAQKQSEARFRSLAETSPAAIFIYQGEKFVYVNSAAEQLTGYTNEELLNKTFWELTHPDYLEMIKQRKLAQRKGETVPSRYEFRIIAKDGIERWVDFAASSIQFEGIQASLGIALDTTNQRMLEQQIRQVQKMESVSTLAEGVAHDFNNVFNIILGYASMTEVHLNEPDKLKNDIKTILDASARGAALVRQLVTLSGKAKIGNEQIDINTIINEIVSLLLSTFPKTIEVVSDIGRTSFIANVNRSQFHQALLSVAMNAKDAMPNGGTLKFSTKRITGKKLQHRNPKAGANEYVHITISDTGKGMDEKTKTRVFDPFFTTKEKGDGVGLGLSVVYGIIESHQGFVDIDSAVDQGTTIHIFIPIISSPKFAPQVKEEYVKINGGSETLLVVEDESTLREFLRVILEEKGYTVLMASDGSEGVELFNDNRDKVALVISDLGMPKLDGLGLLRKIQEIKPDVKVIVTSGLIDPERTTEILNAGAREFLAKPYSGRELLLCVREILDSAN
ncbi:MAG: response regulator [Bacteroidetes bacterium]|nr:response regulator [Bacteroidota bacterium]